MVLVDKFLPGFNVNRAACKDYGLIGGTPGRWVTALIKRQTMNPDPTKPKHRAIEKGIDNRLFLFPQKFMFHPVFECDGIHLSPYDGYFLNYGSHEFF